MGKKNLNLRRWWRCSDSGSNTRAVWNVQPANVHVCRRQGGTETSAAYDCGWRRSNVFALKPTWGPKSTRSPGQWPAFPTFFPLGTLVLSGHSPILILSWVASTLDEVSPSQYTPVSQHSVSQVRTIVCFSRRVSVISWEELFPRTSISISCSTKTCWEDSL